MKLSLYILEKWFKEHNYTVTPHIKNGEPILVSFRISDEPLPENIGQIGALSLIDAASKHPDASVIISGSDYLTIHGISQEETLSEAYHAFEYFSSWESTLYQKLSSNTSLQELLDLTKDIFHRPMSICNSRGWDYAMTTGEGPYIHPLRETFSNDNPDETTQTVTDRQTFLNSLNDLRPIVTYSDSHGCNVLFTNIWLDGERAGAILVFEDEKPFSRVDLQLMYFFQEVITIYATVNKGVLRSRSALSEYLIDILDHKNVSNYAIKKILKYPNWKSDDNYAVLTIASKSASDSIFLNRLCDDLELAPFRPQSFIYANRIVSLINLKNCMGRSMLIKQIKETVSADSFYWGLSHEFCGISLFAQFYNQSCVALDEAGKSGSCGKTMRDISLKLLQKRCLSDQALCQLLHPDVLYLINYDRLKHSTCAITLYYYLLYSCNFTDAANHLNLHRNTMIYRISRIEQMISADLTNTDEREYLLFSFILYKNMLAEEKKAGD